MSTAFHERDDRLVRPRFGFVDLDPYEGQAAAGVGGAGGYRRVHAGIVGSSLYVGK